MIDQLKYNEDDFICINCIEDNYLRELVLNKGKKKTCVICENKSISVSVRTLASLIDPYIREHYRHGSDNRIFSLDDDSPSYEQEGDDLSYVVQELVGQYFEFHDVLVNTLIDNDQADISSGEEVFYDCGINYVEMHVHFEHLYEDWRAISDEIRTERRFFSDRAQKFFDWIFEGIEDLWVYEQHNSTSLSEATKSGVIQEWPAGKIFYRARRADTQEDITRLVLNPIKELAPPPSNAARAGRMNAAGITIFYGSPSFETCLAEMRSSIGGHTVVGRFETTMALRILDFSRLEKAWSDKRLSYFQHDFEEQVTRSKFLRKLHMLISQPVISGHEDEYLITQVLAEYLAYVRKGKFNGLLFSSTQYEGGMNVVLFPECDNIMIDKDNALSRFPLIYVDGSAEVHQTIKIKYDFKKESFIISGDKVHLYNLDYED